VIRALRLLRVLVAERPDLGRSLSDVVTELEQLPGSTASQASRLPDPEPERVRRWLAGLSVGVGVGSGPLRMFSVRWDSPRAATYRTLDEALADQSLRVGEISDGGSVPTLEVENRSNQRVFIMAGEQLVGAKQNRVVNASFMVDAHARMPFPVSCVEQGRWAYRSRNFASAGTSSHASLRYLMNRHAYEGYHRHGSPTSDQGAVWDAVHRVALKTGTSSPTGALHDVYSTAGDRLEAMSNEIAADPHACGAVFACGGRIVGLDLFDQPATLGKLWPKLVRAYAMDALGHEAESPVTRDQVVTWIDGFSRCAVDSFRSPGIGTDVRFMGRRVIGAMLVVDETPVHVEAFYDEA